MSYNLEESSQVVANAPADSSSVTDISSLNAENSPLPLENSETSMSIDQPLQTMHTATHVRNLELRVQQLEDLLEEYKRAVKGLEEELERKNNTSFSFAFDSEDDGAGLGRIQERFKSFERKIKEVEEEKFELRNGMCPFSQTV